VWTHLASWLVKTGEVPQLEIGDTFPEVAVRASCWSVTRSSGPDGVMQLPGPDPAGDASLHYALTGVVEWGRKPDALLLRVGQLTFLAEPREGLDFSVPAVGERITVLATLEVLQAYETEAFELPDIRRDWRVGGLKVEHRELVAAAEFPDSRVPGRILQVDDIPRMLRWADDSRRDHATYLLDLEPTP
jgi:hypothetical protein